MFNTKALQNLKEILRDEYGINIYSTSGRKMVEALFCNLISLDSTEFSEAVAAGLYFKQRYPGLSNAAYNGIVALYDPADGRGISGTTLVDLARANNGNDLTLVHVPVEGSESEIYGNVLSYDGTNDYTQAKVYNPTATQDAKFTSPYFKASMVDGAAFVDIDGVNVPELEELGANIVTNGDMELDANWSNDGTPTVNERSTTQVHGETYSRKFTVDAAQEGIKSSPYGTVVKDTLYKFIAWVYPDDTTTVRIVIRSGDNTENSFLEEVTGLTQDAWNKITRYYFEPDGGASGIIYFTSSTGVVAGTWYIDDVTSVPVTNAGLSQVAGTTGSSTPYSVILTDSGGNKAWGFVGSAGTGETLGAELVTDGAFANITLAAAKVITGITSANPGVVTFAAGHGYVKGTVIKIGDGTPLTEMTELNGQYWKLRSPGVGVSADIFNGWDFGVGWVLVNNATITDADTFTSNDTVTTNGIRSPVVFTPGDYYRINVVGTTSAGAVRIDQGTGFAITTSASPFNITIDFVATATTILIRAGAGTASTIDITTLTVKELSTFELSANGIATWDAASLDTSGYAAETTGGSAEKVDFTNWTEGLGWHPGVDGAGALTGTADCDGEQVAVTLLSQPGLVSDAVHKSVYTTSSYASGEVSLLIGGAGSSETDHKSSDGTFTEYMTEIGADTLYIVGNTTLVVSIDDISVKQVLTPDATGVELVSSNDGSTRNWAYKHASFLPNSVTSVQVVKASLMALGLAGNVNISMSMWVKPDDGQPAGGQGLVSVQNTVDGYRKFTFYAETTGKIYLYLSSDGAWNIEQETTDAAVFPNGACSWTHVAWVYNGTTVVIYINSAAVASTTGGGGIPPALHPSPALFTLAALSNYVSKFAGKQGPILVFNVALSAAEVQRLYLADRPRFN